MNPTRQTVAATLDHTVLAPEADLAAIHRLVDEVFEHGFASACVHPHFVSTVARRLPSDKVCTVIGFPLGLQTVKLYEAQKAVEDGAGELDIVVNPFWVATQEWGRVEEELVSFRTVFPELVLKLIFETSRMDALRVVELTRICSRVGFDLVKTSTGFASQGATVDMISLMAKNCSGRTLVKASGGVRTAEDWKRFWDAGARRFGTSSALAILDGFSD